MIHPTLAPEPDTDADAMFRNWMRLNLDGVPTTRSTVTQTRIDGLVRAAFGRHRNLRINRWETVYWDLYWSILLQ